MRSTRWLALAGLLLLLGAGTALAGPQDTRVGETRVAYNRAGTVLRQTPAITGAPVATLPSGTAVTVLEVTLPWVRVRSANPPAEGWIRAFEAVEPAALAASPPPPSTLATAAAPRADERDLAAAGRQLTAGTESRYRASRRDLDAAYAAVDRLERETAAMAAADAISFIMEGNIGRRGRDYLPPPRLPAGDQLNEKPKSTEKVKDVVGKLGGELAGRLGLGKRSAENVGKVVEGGIDLLGAARQIEKAFSPGQEYYLGRGVAANAIARYGGVDRDESLRRYVRQVGDAVVRMTDRLRGTHGGYNFEVLASDEVNGVAGPGGFVLVTRGAVRACRTEDELAAILSHELSHVERKDGENIVRRGKRFQAITSTFVKTAGEVARLDDERFQGQLLQVFTEAVGEMSRTATDHAYGRDLEGRSDVDSTYFLHDVFYDWTGMRSFLLGIATVPALSHGGADHAPPSDRARALDPVLQPLGAFPRAPGEPDPLMARFLAATAALRAAPPAGPR